MLQVFNDDDVREHVDAPTAVRAVRSALLAHHDGTLVAPARVRAGLGDGDLVFTAGHLRRQGLFGFRAYDTFAGAEQLVAVWDARSGALRAVVHGAELGVRRTGAIGAVAVDAAARPGPVRLGLVGAGVQAWAQLWAVRAVRPVVSVTVASRHLERAQEFARRATRELGVDVRAVSRAEEAVRDHDVVIVATTSTAPVLEADWIAPGTHVSTLGPKSATHHEVPPALCDRADVLFTDSLAQAAGYPEPHLFAPGRMVELGAILAAGAGVDPGVGQGDDAAATVVAGSKVSAAANAATGSGTSAGSGTAAARTDPDQITVFCSVGLAGTEVAVAATLCDTAS